MCLGALLGGLLRCSCGSFRSLTLTLRLQAKGLFSRLPGTLRLAPGHFARREACALCLGPLIRDLSRSACSCCGSDLGDSRLLGRQLCSCASGCFALGSRLSLSLQSGGLRCTTGSLPLFPEPHLLFESSSFHRTLGRFPFFFQANLFFALGSLGCGLSLEGQICLLGLKDEQLRPRARRFLFKACLSLAVRPRFSEALLRSVAGGNGSLQQTLPGLRFRSLPGHFRDLLSFLCRPPGLCSGRLSGFLGQLARRLGLPASHFSSSEQLRSLRLTEPLYSPGGFGFGYSDGLGCGSLKIRNAEGFLFDCSSGGLRCDPPSRFGLLAQQLGLTSLFFCLLCSVFRSTGLLFGAPLVFRPSPGLFCGFPAGLLLGTAGGSLSDCAGAFGDQVPGLFRLAARLLGYAGSVLFGQQTRPLFGLTGSLRPLGFECHSQATRIFFGLPSGLCLARRIFFGPLPLLCFGQRFDHAGCLCSARGFLVGKPTSLFFRLSHGLRATDGLFLGLACGLGLPALRFLAQATRFPLRSKTCLSFRFGAPPNGLCICLGLPQVCSLLQPSARGRPQSDSSLGGPPRRLSPALLVHCGATGRHQGGVYERVVAGCPKSPGSGFRRACTPSVRANSLSPSRRDGRDASALVPALLRQPGLEVARLGQLPPTFGPHGRRDPGECGPLSLEGARHPAARCPRKPTHKRGTGLNRLLNQLARQRGTALSESLLHLGGEAAPIDSQAPGPHSLENHSVEPRPSEVGAGEVGAGEVGKPEVRPDQKRPGQLPMPQRRLKEHGSH